MNRRGAQKLIVKSAFFNIASHIKISRLHVICINITSVLCPQGRIQIMSET